MPTVPSRLLNCSFYVYKTEQDARDGVTTNGGACGFFVGMPSEVRGWHSYAVTCKHVVDDGGLVMRITTKDGQTHIVPTQFETWETTYEDDIAVLPFDMGGISMIVDKHFLPETNQGTKALAVGDEAVLVGRLITHDGRQRNKPVARFGNISMMADADYPVHMGVRPDGTVRGQVAFLVDCRSLGGASGSAVLAYRVPQREGMLHVGPTEMVFLGIDCGHLPFWTPVCEQKNPKTKRASMWVESNSGIAVVAPAWKISDILHQEHFVMKRKEIDEARRKEAEEGSVVIQDSASDEESET